jgi:hypothetical protein
MGAGIGDYGATSRDAQATSKFSKSSELPALPSKPLCLTS